ncbi:unnamed protein product [Linum trigynum]|uniref:C2H2-type domain-containing protein n=1 Tax=Linum trigynum TaxID=586398 RepID=A0AAV2DR60_9ROSI
METHYSHNPFDRRPIVTSKTPAVKWFREWVPQDVVATGGKCSVLRWVTESQSKALKERAKDPPTPEPEPEPTTEVLFLCSYDGCGKTFIDAGALRKHSHIHGERQYVCHWEGCGKKFIDSSKLKRHNLIHTGERNFVCPHEDCGKAFSLDFNLRSHMKTHSQENYHICPYPECGKRYAHDYKLRNHIQSQHEKVGYVLSQSEKNATPPVEMVRYATPPERPTIKAPKPPSSAPPSATPASTASASVGRPFGCPSETCRKAYIHEYKLKLHLKNHPDHNVEETTDINTIMPRRHHAVDNNDSDEGSDQDGSGYGALKRAVNGRKKSQSSRVKPSLKMPPAKMAQRSKGSSPLAHSLNVAKKPWPPVAVGSKGGEVYGGEEDDSEETEEEDRESGDDGWRYRDDNEDDDEETEYED